MTEPREHPKDPLHGVTLEAILHDLVERRGWHDLHEQVRIHCFGIEPSIKSSLKLLRRTPWAREKVEQLYVADQQELGRRKPPC